MIRSKGLGISLVAMNEHSQLAATPLYEFKAEFFKAMSHPVRIRVLELLASGPLGVGELKAQINVSAPHLSQQLNVLKRAGLITSERNDKYIVYSLAFDELVEFLSVARRILIDVLAKRSNLLIDLQASVPLPEVSSLRGREGS